MRRTNQTVNGQLLWTVIERAATLATMVRVAQAMVIFMSMLELELKLGLKLGKIPSPVLSLYPDPKLPYHPQKLPCDTQRAERQPTELLRSTRNRVHWPGSKAG